MSWLIWYCFEVCCKHKSNYGLSTLMASKWCFSWNLLLIGWFTLIFKLLGLGFDISVVSSFFDWVLHIDLWSSELSKSNESFYDWSWFSYPGEQLRWEVYFVVRNKFLHMLENSHFMLILTSPVWFSFFFDAKLYLLLHSNCNLLGPVPVDYCSGSNFWMMLLPY